MPRSRQRATLEAGIKLDINRLIRRGSIEPGSDRCSSIAWTNSYDGELLASGTISADMTDAHEGWFKIDLDDVRQQFSLRSMPRHFGGRQWYFVCPRRRNPVSVLWMPPGADIFASRKHWGRQVAYQSQFLDRDNRAHRGQAKINRRLCQIGTLDPEEWSFPPKPKWMRRKTYERAEAKFDHYEESLDRGAFELISRLGML